MKRCVVGLMVSLTLVALAACSRQPAELPTSAPPTSFAVVATEPLPTAAAAATPTPSAPPSPTTKPEPSPTATLSLTPTASYAPGSVVSRVDGLIKGLTGAPPYLYLASGPGLTILDASDARHPQQIGRLTLADSSLEDIAVEDGRAVLVGPSGLWIVDVSDPATPQLLGHSSVPSYAKAVAIHNGLAYVAANGASSDPPDHRGLFILDLATPETPTVVGSLPVPYDVYSLAVQDGVAYVSMGSDMVVVDVSDPAMPRQIGAYLQEYGLVQGIALANDLGYLVTLDDFKVMDISDPTAPRRLGNLPADTMSAENYAGDIALAGDVAYVTTRGLNAVDVSNPISPTEIGRLWARERSEDVFLIDDYAYLVVGQSDLQVIDVTHPQVPTVVGNWGIVPDGPAWDDSSQMVPAGVPGNIVAVTLSNGLLFAVEQDRGLWACDLSEPAAPRPVGFKEMPGGFEHLTAWDGFLIYVAKRGLWAVDASDPAEMWLESACCPEGATSFEVQDNIGSGTTWDNGLHIYDMTNAAHPVEVGVFPSDFSQSEVVVRGSIAYLAESVEWGPGSQGRWQSRLSILDVSNPTEPKQIGFFESPGWTEDMAVVGDLVYLAQGGPGVVRVLDVSDPTQPVEMKVYQTGTWTMHVMFVDDDQVFVPIAGNLYAFDTPNTGAAPGLDVLALASAGVVIDGFVYVPAGDQGLMVLRLPEPSNP